MFHMKQNIDNLLLKSKNDLILFEQILKKWQKAVNLISNSTLNDIWNRHVLDSAQLFDLLPINIQKLELLLVYT